MALGSEGYEPKAVRIPPSSDYYRIKHNARVALPDTIAEQAFIAVFDEVTSAKARDFRNLISEVKEVARRLRFRNLETNNIFKLCSDLWHQQDACTYEDRVQLYCRIFVAAVERCPLSRENIYI